jgi:hypothetical protein
MMRIRSAFAVMAWFAIAMLCSAPAMAQRSPAGGPPADPWPRVVDLSNCQLLAYQPQVISRSDNQLDFRVALAFNPDGAKEESFGVIVASARTQVDRVLRTVTFENLRISKVDFPTFGGGFGVGGFRGGGFRR